MPVGGKTASEFEIMGPGDQMEDHSISTSDQSTWQNSGHTLPSGLSSTEHKRHKKNE